MTQSKNSEKWTWLIAILALIVFLDLCALTWYFWTIPAKSFSDLKKVISTVASWLTTLATFFGIRYKFRRKQSFAQVLRIRPVQLCIIAFTILIWYFIVPLHSITILVQESISKQPLSGVTVRVDAEKNPRPTISDDQGKIVIGGLPAAPHDLCFELHGYKQTQRTSSFIDIISIKKSLTVYLEKNQIPIRYPLTVSSYPEGAEIYVNDELRGRTLGTIYLARGHYRITLRKNGKTVQTAVDIPGCSYIAPPLE